MVPSPTPRGGTHPVTGEPIGVAGWSSINGHEWNAGTNDLEYACIFPLAAPRPCTDPASCDCNIPIDANGTPDLSLLVAEANPLCEPPDPQDPSKGAGPTSVVGATQYRAKGYPGLRHLSIARGVEKRTGNAIVGSICAPNLVDAMRPDYGYRAAFDALAARLTTRIE